MTICLKLFLTYFPYLERKRKVCLCDHHAVGVSRHITFRMAEPIFMKLGMYIMAPEPISTAYFINPSYRPQCLHVYPPVVSRQRLGKNVSVATNTHATVEQLLEASFSMRCVSYQRKVCGKFFAELLVIHYEIQSSVSKSPIRLIALLQRYK
jgi:hypothetical protein